MKITIEGITYQGKLPKKFKSKKHRKALRKFRKSKEETLIAKRQTDQELPPTANDMLKTIASIKNGE